MTEGSLGVYRRNGVSGSTGSLIGAASWLYRASRRNGVVALRVSPERCQWHYRPVGRCCPFGRRCCPLAFSPFHTVARGRRLGRVEIDPGTVWRLRSPLVCAWRESGVLQLGERLVLRGAPAQTPEVVAALVGGASGASLSDRFPAVGGECLLRLLGALRRAGVLVPAEPSPTRTVRVLGDGNLARALGQGLRDDGIATRTARLPRLLTAEGLGPAGDYVLTVLATPTCEPDRAVTDALVRDGRPFLVVRLHEGRGSVGPLVVPGRTPCLRCDDLHHRDHDPAWPRVVAQLAHLPCFASAAVAAGDGATARVQAQSVLAGAVPDALGTVLDTEGGVLRARRVESHPECGCPLATAKEHRLGTMAA